MVGKPIRPTYVKNTYLEVGEHKMGAVEARLPEEALRSLTGKRAGWPALLCPEEKLGLERGVPQPLPAKERVAFTTAKGFIQNPALSPISSPRGRGGSPPTARPQTGHFRPAKG